MHNTTTLSAVALACVLATPAALAAPINVAQLYGSATANETHSTNVPANSIDNNNATDWIATGHGSTTDPNWLTVDLGTPYLVDAIDLYWQELDGMFASYTTSYSLFHGLTGTDWTLIGSGIFVDEDLARISAKYLFSPGQSMRFVKYEVDGGSHWSGIAEIRVWSEDSPAVVPEPASLALVMAGFLGVAGVRRLRSGR